MVNNLSAISLSALDLALPLQRKERPYNKKILDQLGLDPVVHSPKPQDSKIVAAVKGAFEKLQSCYYEYVPESVQSTFSWVGRLGEKVGYLIDKIVKFVKGLMDGIRQTSAAVAGNSAFSKLMGKTKILGALAIGGVIYNIVQNSKGLAKSIKKNESGDAVDHGLMLVENVGDLASVGETIAVGLKEFGSVASAGALNAASNVLVGVGTVLSLATVALNSKHWYETAKFREQMNAKFKGADGKDGNFTEMIAFIDEQKPRNLKKIFGVKDGRELKLRLQAILQKNRGCDDQESKEIVEKTTHALKKRLVTKEIFHGLKILAAVISIVASAVLLFTPVAPLAFAFLALSTVIVISVLVADHFMDSQFEKALNDIVPESAPLKMLIPPQRPQPLKAGATAGEKLKHEKAMKKYYRDLVKYCENKELQKKEIKYSQPIAQHKWNKNGRSAFRKKIGKIVHWKPRPWKATEKNNGAIASKSKESEIPLSDESKALPTKAKLKPEKQMELEAQGGMTFDEIKSWKPKDLAASA